MFSNGVIVKTATKLYSINYSNGFLSPFPTNLFYSYMSLKNVHQFF